MKKKILWLMLSWLIVAALVLASCGEAVPGEQEEEEEEEEEAGLLQRGGTLTVLGGVGDPPNPAFADVQYGSLWWLENIQQRPVMGDVETYGPRGTDEYPFTALMYIPAAYMRGLLLESWEITPDRLVWNVRPGIYWAADNVDWMENREFTAEDMVADIIEFLECPWKGRFEAYVNIDDAASVVYATDRYTLVIEMEHYSPMVPYYIGYEDRALYAPPEMIAAGADIWENQVGTGPFMFEEYVVGSYMSFVRNPNYWGKTTIEGVEYQMPFVDRVMRPIIPDISTQIAALQTGTLDIGRSMDTKYWDMFDTEAPEMEKLSFTSGAGTRIYLRCDEPPFDDVNVRRAVAIGTDLWEFKEAARALETPVLFYPVVPEDPAYIPLEELPADVQILFEYDPDEAIRLLTEALGPPDADGFFFKTTLMISAEVPAWHDDAALLQDQWSKIGVTVEIEALSQTVYKDAGFPIPEVQYHGLYFDAGGNSDPVGAIDVFLRSTGLFNRSMYRNEQLDEIMLELDAELDPVARVPLIQEILLLALPDVDQLQLHYDPGRTYWWPWVKNYYGELSLQDDGSFAALFPFIWIDQDLKAEMGF